MRLSKETRHELLRASGDYGDSSCSEHALTSSLPEGTRFLRPAPAGFAGRLRWVPLTAPLPRARTTRNQRTVLPVRSPILMRRNSWPGSRSCVAAEKAHPAEMIVLDANIIRAVLGRRVRRLIDTCAGQGIRFFAADVAFDDTEKYLPPLLKKQGRQKRMLAAYGGRS